jgi:hypothetical protein
MSSDTLPSDYVPASGVPAPVEVPPQEPAVKHATLATVTLLGGAALLFLVNLAVWVDNSVLDSEGFVAAVDETMARDDVQQRMASVITTQMLQSDDYRQFVDEELPRPLSAVEPVLRGRVQPLIESALAQILASEVVGDVRNEVLTRLHDRLMTVLRDEGQVVDVQGDSLVIDVNQQVEGVLEGLGIEAPPALGGGPDGSGLLGDAGTIVLVEDAGPLRQVSWLVDNWGAIIAVLVVLTTLAFAVTLLLRGESYRGVRAIAGAVLAVGVFTLILGVGVILGLMIAEPERIVLREFVRDLMSGLRQQSALLILLGIAVMLLSATRMRVVLSRSADALSTRLSTTALVAGSAFLALILLLVS